jgi:hypothetical protein
MDKIQFVERGMSYKSLLSVLETYPFSFYTVVDPEDGIEYQVKWFPMETGTTLTYNPGYHIGDEYILGGLEETAATEIYAFLFFEDSLLFWGFLHEFARSNDPLIRRLAPFIIQPYKQRQRKDTLNQID